MDQLAQDIASTAKGLAENFSDRGDFDYSVESLELIEDLLEEVAESAPEEESVNNAAALTGCYIFEVARRLYGGRYFWDRSRNQPVLVTGEPDFAVSIFAFEKARGRIVNGIEDKIPFYFQGYVEAVERGRREQGYTACIV